MSDIIKTENLTFAYPPDEGKEPVQALRLQSKEQSVFSALWEV